MINVGFPYGRNQMNLIFFVGENTGINPRIVKCIMKKAMLKTLDLFSGIGGFSLGLERTGNFETVAFCEIDKYCKLLLQKHWKGVKIYDDVKKITKEGFEADGIPSPDVITGGFPCQPFSVAGKQKGTSDDRHLWPEMFRIIKAFKPRFVIGENVRGIINIQDGVVFETVCTDLESEGYEVQPFIIPAAGVGAPHRRERVWIIAIREESMVNSDNIRFEQHNETEEEASRRRSSATFEPTGTTNVVNTISNDEGREISRSDEETRGIQKEHRTENSTTGQSSRTSEIRRSNDGYETMENSRRTLQQRTELRETNEDEIRKEDANQHQRSGSPSESDVADTYARLSNGQVEEVQPGWNFSLTGSEDVANTERERLQGSRRQESSRNFYGLEQGSKGNENKIRSESERRSRTPTDVANTESSIRYDNEAVAGNGEFKTQEVSGDGSSVRGESAWWDFEPDVGRVAHGIPGRVYRLKGLGNSIIPQIAQEIGNAIIKAESEE